MISLWQVCNSYLCVFQVEISFVFWDALGNVLCGPNNELCIQTGLSVLCRVTHASKSSYMPKYFFLKKNNFGFPAVCDRAASLFFVLVLSTYRITVFLGNLGYCFGINTVQKLDLFYLFFPFIIHLSYLRKWVQHTWNAIIFPMLENHIGGNILMGI